MKISIKSFWKEGGLKGEGNAFFKKVSFPLLLFFLMISDKEALATPTGLNNIPTADVTPEKTVVFQQFSTFGHRQRPTHSFGFKYGLWKNIEVGADRRYYPDKSDHPSAPFDLQMKVRLPIPGLEQYSQIGLGVDNLPVSENGRERIGPAVGYAVLTQDLFLFRGHFGYMWQKHNDSLFGGLDRKLTGSPLNLTFRADIIETNDRRDALGSVGFICDLPFNFLLEGWYSMPTNKDAEEFGLIKLNYVIKF